MGGWLWDFVVADHYMAEGSVMRILILQSAGKHKANANYREALSLDRALNGIEGVSSVVWGHGYPNYVTGFESMVKAFDCVLLLENYTKIPWVPNMSGLKKLKLFWSIDAHVVFSRHAGVVKQHKIDAVLSSTSIYKDKFGVKGYWFPNCYDDTLVKYMPEVKKIHNVGFCGNRVNRGQWINKLAHDMGMKVDVMVIGDSMVRAVNSYKIHWNRNYSTDVNYRTFETLGCKTALLTNNTDKLSSMFTIGKHLLVYKNYADCCNKIRYLLKNDKARNDLAEAGYNHVIKNHTYKNRARLLVDIIKERI